MTEQTSNEHQPEQNLNEQFRRIFALQHRYFSQKRGGNGPYGNPQRGQGRVLALLKMQPEISQKELAYLLDMRPQSLGELLSKLEKVGFITRTPSETDRRVMKVSITEAGIEAMEKNKAEKSQDKLFSIFTEEEQAQLSGFLDRLIGELEKQVPDDKHTAHHGGGRGHHHGGGGNPYGYGHGGSPFDGFARGGGQHPKHPFADGKTNQDFPFSEEMRARFAAAAEFFVHEQDDDADSNQDN